MMAAANRAIIEPRLLSGLRCCATGCDRDVSRSCHPAAPSARGHPLQQRGHRVTIKVGTPARLGGQLPRLLN